MTLDLWNGFLFQPSKFSRMLLNGNVIGTGKLSPTQSTTDCATHNSVPGQLCPHQPFAREPVTQKAQTYTFC